MAQTRSKTTRGGTSARRKTTGGTGQKALTRLNDSIDAAQVALKDVRSEMSRGSREVLKDLDAALKDARKNLRSVSRRVTKDLDDMQKAVRGTRPAAARKTSTAGKRTATQRKATSTAGRRTTTARKTTATRSTARKRTTTKK